MLNLSMFHSCLTLGISQKQLMDLPQNSQIIWKYNSIDFSRNQAIQDLEIYTLLKPLHTLVANLEIAQI